jgi:hypothetical protein
VSHFRRKASRTIIPERNARTGQTTEQRAWLPNHDDHVHTYRNYWDEQGEKLNALSLRFLFLAGIKRNRESAVDLSSEDVTIKSELPRAMVTVNDWAKAKVSNRFQARPPFRGQCRPPCGGRSEGRRAPTIRMRMRCGCRAVGRA